MNRFIVVLSALALVVVLSGCVGKNTVTEGDRNLSHQNLGAAKVIQSRTSDPGIVAPARDVEANSAQQIKNWGMPEKPEPYSTAASAGSRKQSEEEHATPWWKLALGGLGTVLGTLLSQGMLARLLPLVFGGPMAGVAAAAVEGIARLREKILASDQGVLNLNEDDLLETIGKAQQNPQVKAMIQKLAHAAEAKLGVRL
jgi:hypothetical protein